MTPQALIPALLVPLIGYRVYRRFRTSFGRQPVQTNRLVLRIVLLSAIATALLLLSLSQVELLAAAAVGLALGGIVGVIGLRLSTFEHTPEGSFYTPNRYIGVTVTTILVARLVYRFFVVMPTLQTPAAAGNPYAGYAQSPLTLAILMLMVGYYVCYSAGILLKARAARHPPG
ncbi:MAG TPA: hypothetical protein VG994_08470 [Steroidobacteraceae bacterium]|nr:hypothetical protein [Steroidobacteraceae bacterium]